MVGFSLFRPSTTITIVHSSTPCPKASGHVGALCPALSIVRAENNLRFQGIKIRPSHIKFNRNRIRHVGVAYDQKNRSAIVPRASATTNSEEEDILGSITILTVTGEPVLFRDLWDQSNGMAVVALLSHIGLPCCWELASTLKYAKPKFDSAGVKLIAIGIGTPDKARIFAERLPFPLYADPDRKGKVFTRLESYQKALKNDTISATPEDRSSVLQLGGMYVFKGKQILYSWKEERIGDHAPLDDILNVCRTVPVN